MVTVPPFTAPGRRLLPGLTYDAHTREVGPDLLPVDAKRYREDLHAFHLHYSEVRSGREVRDFLGVSAELSVQIKAGLVPVDGQGACLRELLFEPDTAHVLLGLRCLTFQEYIRPSDHTYVAQTSAEGLGTHVVRAVTYGGHLLVWVKVRGCAQLRRKQVSGGTKGPLPPLTKVRTARGVGGRLTLEEELTPVLQALAEAAHLEVRCYPEGRAASLEEVVDLLETFPQRLPDAEVVELELQPLTVMGLQGARRYRRNQTLRPLVGRFEEHYDDMRTAQMQIDAFYCAGSELTDDGSEQLATVSEQLRGLMTSYEQCIGQLDAEVSLRVKEEFMEVMHEYGNLEGTREAEGAHFTRRVAHILTEHIIDYKGEDYDVIDEAVWRNYRERGWTVQQIQQEDVREKCRLDTMLRHYTLPVNKCKTQQFKQAELRIVLIGKTGVGKSATGNTIVGDRKTFHASVCAHSVTQTVQESRFEVGGRRVRLLDTPGLFDTDRDKSAIDFELAKVLSEFCEGVHAFIYVMNLASHRFTAEEQAAVSEVKKIFGDELMTYTIIVLTHADAVLTDKSLQAFVEELPVGPFRDVVVTDVRMRVMAINNNFRLRVEQERQRDAVLGLVDLVQEERKGHCYTNAMFQKAKKLRSEKARHSERLKRNTRQHECQRYEEAASRVREVSRQITREEFMTKSVAQIEREEGAEFRQVVAKVTTRVRSLLQRTEKDSLTYLDAIVTADGRKTVDQIVLEEVRAAAVEYKTDKRRRAVLQSMRDYVEVVLKKHALDVHTDAFSSTQATQAVRARLPAHLAKYIDDADILREIQVQVGSNTIRNAIETRIRALTDELHEVVRVKVEAYVHGKTRKQMEAVAQRGFRATLQEVAVQVRAALGKDALAYFSAATLDETIVDYVKENQEHLERLAAQQYFCFPADAVVTTPRGDVSMASLMTGEEVLTFCAVSGRLKYEKVILFSHADPVTPAYYVCLCTASGHVVRMSAQHLLPVGRHNHLQPASEVTVGDVVFVAHAPSGELRANHIVGISGDFQRGAFCPHTSGGSIIVDGVAASCYTTIISPQVAHLVLLPVRMLHWMMPRNWFRFLIGYTEDGIPALLDKVRGFFIHRKLVHPSK